MTDLPRDLAAALVDEATKKSGIVWLAPVPAGRGAAQPQLRPQAVWLLWQEGAAYVLHGGSEQPAPALDTGATTVAVAVRSKDDWRRLVTWHAAVERLVPGSDEWEAIVPTLLGKRLNLPDGEAAAARWAAECTLSKLTPTGVLAEFPGAMPDDGEAAPPPETPATTYTPLPFVVGTATTKPPKPRRLRGLHSRWRHR